MSEESPAAASAPQPETRRGRSKLLMMFALTSLLFGGAGGTWWWQSRAAHPRARKPDPVPPQYLALDPPFVVNFETDQLVRFLQVTVQLMSRDPATIELLKSNDPLVRNELLLLFANQKYSVLATRAGKETLRADALATLRTVLAGAGGHPERLEAVYFTSFVMQ